MPLNKSSQKDEIRSKILRENTLPPKSRALVLLDIADREISEFFLEAGKSLDIAIIIATGSEKEKSEYAGYDAFVSLAKDSKIDIIALVQASVVPILPIENAYPKTFSEFDPMKFEGNAFLFASADKYLILEKLIRYLENIRYAGDKRTLTGNVEKTF
jgi:hypothetical protein